MNNRSKPLEETLDRYLADPEEASAYLEAVLESGDTSALMVALRDVVKARGGMTKLAETSDMSRETLYRTLSEEGNPTLETLTKVLQFAGLRISVAPMLEPHARAS